MVFNRRPYQAPSLETCKKIFMKRFRGKQPKKKRRTWAYKYGYYNYVRLTVSAASLYGLYIVRDMDSNLWRYIFAALLVLYNNIKPLHLKPNLWNFLDCVTLGIILVTFFLI